MAISFGLSKIITEHPIYNFCIALPFVCAFYVMNSKHIYYIPIINYDLSKELSMLIDICGVILYYIFSLLVLFLSTGLSRLTTQSKLWYIYFVLIILTSLYSCIWLENIPRIGLLSLTLALPFLILQLTTKNKILSAAVVVLTAGLISLFSFIVGILWLEDCYLFSNLISSVFGLNEISDKSYKIGAIMLIAIGYVIYFSVFEASKFWHDEA